MHWPSLHGRTYTQQLLLAIVSLIAPTPVSAAGVARRRNRRNFWITVTCFIIVFREEKDETTVTRVLNSRCPSVRVAVPTRSRLCCLAHSVSEKGHERRISERRPCPLDPQSRSFWSVGRIGVVGHNLTHAVQQNRPLIRSRRRLEAKSMGVPQGQAPWRS